MFSGEEKGWRTPLKRLRGHMRETPVNCNQANSEEIKVSCKALGSKRGHSKRRPAEYRRKDRGRNEDVEDGD